jgi:hypothetical protein
LGKFSLSQQECRAGMSNPKYVLFMKPPFSAVASMNVQRNAP